MTYETDTETPRRPAPPSAPMPSRGPQPIDKRVVIALMGATGSGKTSFANLVSGSDMRIGDGLESCTDRVQVSVQFELDGRQIELVDTPGFDDTSKSDADILKMIADHLCNSYSQGKKLAGVIYLHRISDFRFSGVASRNFKMFRELCGDKTLKNVVIVTTMWSEVTQAKGVKRETELADKFFKSALDKQAQLLRHNNTLESAQAVLHYIIHNHPLPLQIQEEIVDKGKSISETFAAHELNRELMEEKRKFQAQMKKLQEETIEAIKTKDKETQQELEEERQKLQTQMRKVQMDSEKLLTNFKESNGKLEERLKKIEEEHEKKRKELEKQLEEAKDKTTTDRLIADLRSRNQEGVFTHFGRALDAAGREVKSWFS